MGGKVGGRGTHAMRLLLNAQSESRRLLLVNMAPGGAQRAGLFLLLEPARGEWIEGSGAGSPWHQLQEPKSTHGALVPHERDCRASSRCPTAGRGGRVRRMRLPRWHGNRVVRVWPARGGGYQVGGSSRQWRLPSRLAPRGKADGSSSRLDDRRAEGNKQSTGEAESVGHRRGTTRGIRNYATWPPQAAGGKGQGGEDCSTTAGRRGEARRGEARTGEGSAAGESWRA